MRISNTSDLFTFPLSLFCEQVDGEYPISCFSNVLTPDDLPALGAYEQQILERIEVGKQAGNVHWIEVNQKNLNERVRPAIALLKQTPPSVVRETGQGVMTGQSFVASTPEISEGIYRADLLTFRDDTLPRKDLRSQEEEDGGSAWPGQSLAWGGLHSLNRGMKQLVPCLRKASHSFMQWATRCSPPSTWRVWQV